ncbi:MAG: CHRD domain-containing protein [Luteitalea sp.]|nr:CHRD domain-containing protein [Luteitalea sp.]
MISRLPLVLVAAALVSVAATPASAQVFTLTATLTGEGEATQTANGVTTGAFGDATVIVDLTARTVNYSVRVFNLPSGVTQGHIHAGAIRTAGPVVVNFVLPVSASNDFSFTGTARDTEFVLRPEVGIRSADDMFQAILGGNSYVNVHSSANPGGEVRGQLTLRP